MRSFKHLLGYMGVAIDEGADLVAKAYADELGQLHDEQLKRNDEHLATIAARDAEIAKQLMLMHAQKDKLAERRNQVEKEVKSNEENVKLIASLNEQLRVQTGATSELATLYHALKTSDQRSKNILLQQFKIVEEQGLELGKLKEELYGARKHADYQKLCTEQARADLRTAQEAHLKRWEELEKMREERTETRLPMRTHINRLPRERLHRK